MIAENPDDPSQFTLTVEQAAEILQVSKSTVRRRIREGTLPTIDNNPRGQRHRHKLRPSDVERLRRGEDPRGEEEGKRKR